MEPLTTIETSDDRGFCYKHRVFRFSFWHRFKIVMGSPVIWESSNSCFEVTRFKLRADMGEYHTSIQEKTKWQKIKSWPGDMVAKVFKKIFYRW